MGIAACNLIALTVRYPLYAVLPAVIIARKDFGRWRLSAAHGSARASTVTDLVARGMIGRGNWVFLC